MSFYNWIKEFKEDDNPVGDLARDLLNDPLFPKTDTDGNTLRHYLVTRRASDSCIRAFDRAYGWYCGKDVL